MALFSAYEMSRWCGARFANRGGFKKRDGGMHSGHDRIKLRGGKRRDRGHLSALIESSGALLIKMALGTSVGHVDKHSAGMFWHG